MGIALRPPLASIDRTMRVKPETAWRLVWTAIGKPLRFSITEFDPGHRWAWTVAGVAAPAVAG